MSKQIFARAGVGPVPSEATIIQGAIPEAAVQDHSQARPISPAMDANKNASQPETETGAFYSPQYAKRMTVVPTKEQQSQKQAEFQEGVEMGRLYAPDAGGKTILSEMNHSKDINKSTSFGKVQGEPGGASGKNKHGKSLGSGEGSGKPSTEDKGAEEAPPSENALKNGDQNMMERLMQQLSAAPNLPAEAMHAVRDTFEHLAKETAEAAAKAEEMARWIRDKFVSTVTSPTGMSAEGKAAQIAEKMQENVLNGSLGKESGQPKFSASVVEKHKPHVPAGRTGSLEREAEKIEEAAEKETGPGINRFNRQLQPSHAASGSGPGRYVTEKEAEAMQKKVEHSALPGSKQMGKEKEPAVGKSSIKSRL